LERGGTERGGRCLIPLEGEKPGEGRRFSETSFATKNVSRQKRKKADTLKANPRKKKTRVIREASNFLSKGFEVRKAGVWGEKIPISSPEKETYRITITKILRENVVSWKKGKYGRLLGSTDQDAAKKTRPENGKERIFALKEKKGGLSPKRKGHHKEKVSSSL